MSSKKKKNLNKHKRLKGRDKKQLGPLEAIKSWFKERHPIVSFLLAFIACMAVFYLFYYSSFYRNHLELPFLNFQANISSSILNLFGHNTNVNLTSLAGNEFSVNIKSGCDGLEAMAIFASAIIIFPAKSRLKIVGLLWGITILFILNLLRIAGLYLVGLNFSQTVFDIMHIQGGFILFTMISVLLWFIWMNWTVRKTQNLQQS